jgi:uncharacterized protein (TIGR00730 family)
METISRNNYENSRERDLWNVFKVMGEFVEGYDTLSRVGPCVSIFGSARLKADNKYYELTVDLAYHLARKGFGVISGGGPGVMEAANKGAQMGLGRSVGLCIDLPFEEKPNPFIDSKFLLQFKYFFARKVMFIKYAQAFVVFPGGFGTLDELFEAITLIQTKKIHPFPIILVGSEYWKGLLDWVKSTMMEEGTISENDLKLIRIEDDLNEVVRIIETFNQDHAMAPNF